jgi:hypothetical protein
MMIAFLTAYVNIGSLKERISDLRLRYPNAKFIVTAADKRSGLDFGQNLASALNGADVAALDLATQNSWQALCEHLRCPPPTSAFPNVKDIGQMVLLDQPIEDYRERNPPRPRRDKSPWVVERRGWWKGIHSAHATKDQSINGSFVAITDHLASLDERRWMLRKRHLHRQLGIVSPIECRLWLRRRKCLCSYAERDWASATTVLRRFVVAIDTYSERFEAVFQPSNAPGLVTGFFLHRNSPRQEIDVEIAGNRPDRLLVNVFYNPGVEGANFDYGFRGAPSYVHLGFDASKSKHCFAIEWSACEIRWLVDGRLVHRRVMWDPTPIPKPSTDATCQLLADSISSTCRANQQPQASGGSTGSFDRSDGELYPRSCCN